MIFEITTNGRLDKILAELLDISRNQIEQLIKTDSVLLNGKPLKKSFKLKIGDKIEVNFPKLNTQENIHVNINFEIPIIFEDEDILIINKPPNIVVHPAPSVKEATIVDWLKSKNISLSTISGEERTGIVHRLDKGTTGAMLIAKNNQAHVSLAKQLETREMGRFYLAIISPPLKDNLIVEKPIGRNPRNRLKMGIVENGRWAKTEFRKIALSKNEKYEIIGCRLFTGRTHQIRVHLESFNRVILGDKMYGYKGKEDFEHLYLHANTIYFRHPRTNLPMRFDARINKNIQDFILQKFNKGLIENEKFTNFFNIFDDFSF